MVEWFIYCSGTKMTKRFPVLSADVFYRNVGTPEQRQHLINQALAEQQRNAQTVAWTNRGCWRSYFQYDDIEWLKKELTEMVNEAGLYYQETDPIYKKKTQSFVGSEFKYWTNINKPGGRNAIHEHKLWHYVGCYYLQAEGTGDIVYFNPINLTEGCNPYAPFVSPMSFSPKDGDLLMWPAWLPHEVEMNMSDKPRINIAFNVRFQAPMSLEDAQD